MITKKDFLDLARKAALEFRTVYMQGGFGAPVSKALPRAKTAQYPAFYTAGKCRALPEAQEACPEPLFGFDGAGFVKGLLWGWTGDPSAAHGGAVYGRDGIPDLTAEQIKAACAAVSSDFDSLEPGELLFMPGHVGIFLGDGLCAECTAKWRGGALLSGVSNVGFTGNYPARRWQSHGHMPWLEEEDGSESVTDTAPLLSHD